jgi:hypothetical protein
VAAAIMMMLLYAPIGGSDIIDVFQMSVQVTENKERIQQDSSSPTHSRLLRVVSTVQNEM